MRWIQQSNGSWFRDDDPGEASTSVARVSIAPDEKPILAELAHDKLVLEIGTGLGIATAVLGAAARGLVSIDPDPWVWTAIIPTLRDEFAAPVAFSRHLPPAGPAFELIFIDGDHSAEAVARDTREAITRLAPGGTIVWHDWSCSTVRDGAMSVLSSTATVLELPSTHGLGVYHHG